MVVRAVYWLLVVLQLLMCLHLSIWWLAALVALSYLIVRPSNTAMSSYQVHVTPDAMMGRSEAAASFGRIVMIPFGSAAAGVLLEQVGRIPTLLIFAFAMAVAAAIASLSRSIGSTPRSGDLAEVDQFD